MNIVGLVYLATSKTTGKSYVGKTVDFIKRKIQHKSAAFNLNCKAYNSHFYCALRKYGWEDFSWKILQDQIPEQYLVELEKFYIFLFRTYENGYNDTIGGDEPPSQLGRKNPNVSKSNSLRVGNKHPFYGKNIADKIRSQVWEIIKPNGETEIIRNLNKYCKENNLQQTLMGKVAKGQRNHHKGFSCRKIKE